MDSFQVVLTWDPKIQGLVFGKVISSLLTVPCVYFPLLPIPFIVLGKAALFLEALAGESLAFADRISLF